MLLFCDLDLYGGPQLSRQNLFTYGKINFATAKSFSPRQNHFHSRQNLFTHGKINFATAKSISLTAKSISPRQNQFHSRQNQFRHGKIFLLTAKSFPLTVKSFWLTCSRDISSQIAMGVNPTWRSSLAAKYRNRSDFSFDEWTMDSLSTSFGIPLGHQ